MNSSKHIYPLPAQGDIVWCRFPNVDALGSPGPKGRPALVIAVSDTDHAVEVVYGTTKKVDKIYPTEFVMDPNDPGYCVSGLAARTKFDFGRSVKLIFDTEWFWTAPGMTRNSPLPKLGVLHPSYMRQAEIAYRNALPKK